MIHDGDSAMKALILTAGGLEDCEVVVDGCLLTSGKPADLGAFYPPIVAAVRQIV